MISVAFLFRRRAAAPPPPPLLLPLPHCPPLPFSSMPWVRPEWSFYTKRFSTNCTSVFKVNALGIEKVISSQTRQVQQSQFLLIIIIIVEFKWSSRTDDNSKLLSDIWYIFVIDISNYMYLYLHLISMYYSSANCSNVFFLNHVIILSLIDFCLINYDFLRISHSMA